MKIHIKERQEVGSCNYCDKGVISLSGMGLNYPYDEVIEVKGIQTSTRFCFECFKKLNNFKKKL